MPRGWTVRLLDRKDHPSAYEVIRSCSNGSKIVLAQYVYDIYHSTIILNIPSPSQPTEHRIEPENSSCYINRCVMYFVQFTAMYAVSGCFLSKARAWKMRHNLAGT